MLVVMKRSCTRLPLRAGAARIGVVDMALHPRIAIQAARAPASDRTSMARASACATAAQEGAMVAPATVARIARTGDARDAAPLPICQNRPAFRPNPRT
ncbi:hypothetical protein JR065_01080 [Xanthomonas sp. AmX2]|uniref:hypothetical protein n=1 Tax=Xanthomonas sp. TaxID=29446 RepID=UPI001980011E|nr:hypothetical protein [Xanthomonas sp.]MBN6148919.1 hypothetical protein [Xanthomonas sp.]